MSVSFKQLGKISSPHFSAIFIDRYLPRVIRNIVRRGSSMVALLAFVISFASIDILPLDFSYADGVFFLFAFIYILFALLEFFYHSMKSEGIYSRIMEKNLSTSNFKDYSLSILLYDTDEIDTSRALFENKLGRQILLRAGILPEDQDRFIHSPRTPLIGSILNFSGERVSLNDYLGVLYDADKSLAKFLSENSVGKQEFLGSADVESSFLEKKRREERFWGRENLGSIPSIGRSWSYGISFELGKYGISFGKTVDISSIDIENGYREKEVLLLEGILERNEEANAMIISNNENIARDIVGRLFKRIRLGVALPSIEHKDVVELDWTALVANFKQKAEVEGEILKLLDQCVAAGNVILYIRDFPGFATSVRAIGVNLVSLLSPYLASNVVCVIAQSGSSDFHYFIETNGELVDRFERILPEEIAEKSALPVLIEKVVATEKIRKIFISFGAVVAISNSADRYITLGEMPEKAIDLLEEVVPWAISRGIFVLKKEDVDIFVSEKTGIKIGKVQDSEIERIEQLENILHQRVIGQNEAIDSISSAVRRSRSGLSSPSRPIASFLFLGPTGVGKTETTKALAETFFGGEEKMVRFDMSEYSGADAISRLIGSFAENRSGILADKVRDNPYGVLLLDEFEKSASDVHDLFLQILDEGFFTDALGKKVNCRNLIVIATSNAGSSLIWEALSNGKRVSQEKDNIVNKIIEDRVFRPELINRFDGVILFEPLKDNELRVIARLELEKFKERLKEQEIDFVVTEDLINVVAEKGSDRQFGARSINRAVKTLVEDIVAKKIISGEVKPGGSIELMPEDLV